MGEVALELYDRTARFANWGGALFLVLFGQALAKSAGTEVRFTSKVVSRVPSKVGIYKYYEPSLKRWC